MSPNEAADVPEEVRSLLRGAVLRTQHSLADSSGASRLLTVLPLCERIQCVLCSAVSVYSVS